MKVSRLRWLGVFAGPAVLIAVGALIGILTSEGGSSSGQQVEPLACRELGRYRSETQVPEAKLEPLVQRCEQAKAAAARSPAPLITPAPGTPGPLVPCAQWDPSSGGGCIAYGLIESRQPPAGFERVYRVSNKWAGSDVTVYAGSLYDDASQGVIVVMENDTPANDGSLLGEHRTEA